MVPFELLKAKLIGCADRRVDLFCPGHGGPNPFTGKIGSWRDFMGPLLYLNTPEMQAVEIALRTFQTAKGTEWHLLMAASLLVMVPILVIFIACQRFFIAGLALTGGKS